MHSPVPKIQEGPKAMKRLERVFVDLCRLMPCVSHSGHLYAMHVIDNFSGYVWSLPLRSKGDAASVFQLWHKHEACDNPDQSSSQEPCYQ
jgi:hypothetical protein